jgi:hypothetical protein
MLSEQRRAQLDGIVQQMIENKETDSDIQKVVDDFSQKYSTEAPTAAPEAASAQAPGALSAVAGAAKGLKEATTGLFRGAGKGIASTVLGGGELVERAGSALGNAAFKAVTGKEAPPQAPGAITAAREKLQPQGAAEKFGFSGEQLAELFLPVPGEAKAKLLGTAVDKATLLARAVGMLKAAGGESANLASRVALQTGGDPVSTGTAAVLGGLSVPVGAAFEKIAGATLPKLARKIQEYTLRLTPPQKANLGAKVGEVADYLSAKGITGGPKARLEKVTKIYQDTEKTFQDFLAGEAKDVTASRQKVIDELEALKAAFKDDRDVVAIEKQIDEVKDLLMKRYEENIPIARLNKLKRTTFENAFNEAGTKVRDDIEFVIGDVFKNNIEKATEALQIAGKSVKDFNKEYGTVINARKILKGSVGRPEIGPIARLIGTMIGAKVGVEAGGLPGFIGGGIAGQQIGTALFGTGVRSAAASALQKLGEPGKKTVSDIIRLIQSGMQNR